MSMMSETECILMFFFHQVLLDLLNPAIWNHKTNLQSAVPSNEDDDRQGFINSLLFFLHILFCFCDVQEDVFAMGNSDFELLPSAIKHGQVARHGRNFCKQIPPFTTHLIIFDPCFLCTSAKHASPKLNSSPLKNGGWKTTFLLGFGTFSGANSNISPT